MEFVNKEIEKSRKVVKILELISKNRKQLACLE